MLELINLTKKYGNKTALDSLSVTFGSGVYGLLGANGAGKSTMLNIITKNIPRTSGEVLYNGTDISGLSRKYFMKIGYTPQLQGIYEDFTARDFLHYIGALKGMKSRLCKQQTEQFLDIVCLSDNAHHKLGSFSGGMKQRVLLAAAMLDEPEILILDEPTAGLDPAQRVRLRDYISSVADTRTVLLATHVISDIETISNRVLLLSHGTLMCFDTPQNLINRTREQLRRNNSQIPDHLTLEDVYLYAAKGYYSQANNNERKPEACF